MVQSQAGKRGCIASRQLCECFIEGGLLAEQAQMQPRMGLKSPDGG
jgi:hypothetical protein